MNRIISIIKPIAGILAVIALIYFFPDIFMYFAIAIILSMLGRPLGELINKFHVRNFHLADTISAVLTMIVMFMLLSLVFILVIPLVNRELLILSNLDTDAIVAYFETYIKKIYDFALFFNRRYH